MEKRNTREEILQAALDLFSIRGFESTSISEITEVVGIKKASLYSHFKSKKAILDSLIQEVLLEYNKQSFFNQANWQDEEFMDTMCNMTVEQISNRIIEQIEFIVSNPMIAKARKMLVIEQFQNEQLASLQSKQNYRDVLQFHLAYIQLLIDKGVLVDEDAEMMAYQFCMPISVWINLCDREPCQIPAVLQLIKRHVTHFFKIYGKKEDAHYNKEEGK